MRRSLLLVVPTLLLLAACMSDGRRFTPEAWRQVDPYERNVFTADLVGRRLLIGKGWHEVNQMLGPGRTLGPEASTWNVALDEQTGGPIVLQVDFRDGIAYRAQVHRE